MSENDIFYWIKDLDNNWVATSGYVYTNPNTLNYYINDYFSSQGYFLPRLSELQNVGNGWALVSSYVGSGNHYKWPIITGISLGTGDTLGIIGYAYMFQGLPDELVISSYVAQADDPVVETKLPKKPLEFDAP